MNLEPQLIAQLKMRQAIIEQHRYLAALVEAERNAILQQSTGVDVSKGIWSLDLEQGVLNDVSEPAK